MVAEQLVGRGITDRRVLDVLSRVPRELFVPASQQGQAYTDGALPIDCQQTISQPYMVARMTELLELRGGERVLEVGTGSGYQTAVLAGLAGHVFTVEWHLKLLNQAAARLESLGITNVTFRCTDGSLGWPEKAPFDAIIVTAGSPTIPPPLVRQLAREGRLVVPAGPPGDQTLYRVRNSSAGVETEEIIKCRFVKLVGAAGWRE